MVSPHLRTLATEASPLKVPVKYVGRHLKPSIMHYLPKFCLSGMAALVWGNQNPFHRSLELFGLITTPYIKRLFGSLRIIPCYCLGNLVQQKPNSPWWVWFPLKANLGTGEEHASRIQGGNNLRHPPPPSLKGLLHKVSWSPLKDTLKLMWMVPLPTMAATPASGSLLGMTKATRLLHLARFFNPTTLQKLRRCLLLSREFF